MKPTVIQVNDKEKRGTVKPTVMPTSNSSVPIQAFAEVEPCSAMKPKATPTVIPTAITATLSAVKTRNVESVPVKPTSFQQKEVEAPAKVVIVKPTAMPGHERKRIPVTVSELGIIGISLDQAVLEGARKLVEKFDLDSANDRVAVLWGSELQANYGKLVNETLALSQSTVLSAASKHLGRMIEILDSFDFVKMCAEPANESRVARFFRKSSASRQASDLANAERELGQILTILGSLLDPLLKLKSEFENVSRSINALGAQIEAHAISAAFIADFMVKNGGHHAEKLLERHTSLLETLDQIRSSEKMRAAQIEQPTRLIGVVQHVALVMVPSWLPSAVLLRKALEANRRPTETELSVLGDQLAGIVNKLKN